MRGIGVLGGVELPQVFKAGTVVDDLPRLRASGFMRAVVHDGRAGVDGSYDSARVGKIQAVMRHHVKIHRAYGIDGTHKGHFFCAGEVGEIEKAELVEGNQNADGTGRWISCG